ncbi:MAG: Flp pilus assembly complex ATPase component TadA, partial [Pseudomonadales bacterium]|nr:Flp pilus assembly complex ATPase component TadA [Pseudomonadales bacterium]
MNAPMTELKGLPKRLVTDGLLDEANAQELLQHCQKEKLGFVQHLVASNTLPAHLIANIAANEFATPLYDISAHNIDSCPADAINKKLINKHQVLPLFKRGGRLFVAVSDPTQQHALTEIRFQSGASIEAVLVEQDKLVTAIDRFLNSQEEDLGDALGTMDDMHLDDLDIQAVDDDALDNTGETSDADDAPIVRFINKLLLDAIKKGSSDIHFEPYETTYRVRFRTDGILEEVTKPPINLAPRLAARLKVMSQLDI